jgi:hypothetical protein
MRPILGLSRLSCKALIAQECCTASCYSLKFRSHFDDKLGMERRPWPIVILAFLHLLEPACKIVLYSLYWHLPMNKIIYATSLKSPWVFFMFFLAFPIAGVAIFCVKRWSLPVFMAIEAMTLIGHFQNFYHAPQYFSLFLVCSLSLLNLIVVSYFLIPAVRLAYLDPKIRWWESKPRYVVEWHVKITQGTHSMAATILNISMGGVLLRESVEALDKNKNIQVEFSHRDEHFTLRGHIAHQSIIKGVYQYGVRFERLSKVNKRRLHGCLKSLEKSGAERRPRKEWFYLSLWQWLYKLVTTGQGLVPHVHKHVVTDETEKEKSPTKKAS